MPVKNFLSQEQKQSLQQALRESEQPELREQVLMLLLMNEGIVWHSCEEYVARRLLQSVTELGEVLNRLLNEGELIIRWGRKIKNKGNAVNAS